MCDRGAQACPTSCQTGCPYLSLNVCLSLSLWTVSWCLDDSRVWNAFHVKISHSHQNFTFLLHVLTSWFFTLSCFTKSDTCHLWSFFWILIFTLWLPSADCLKLPSGGDLSQLFWECPFWHLSFLAPLRGPRGEFWYPWKAPEILYNWCYFGALKLPP